MYSRIAVIHLLGQCRSDIPVSPALRSTRLEGEALGQTHIVEGSVLPIADIRCDRIRRFIDADLRILNTESRGELFGRALGRVMAHELYHILLRTREHGRDGIARPAQSAADLVAARAGFAPRDDRKLADSNPIESIVAAAGSGR